MKIFATITLIAHLVGPGFAQQRRGEVWLNEVAHYDFEGEFYQYYELAGSAIERIGADPPVSLETTTIQYCTSTALLGPPFTHDLRSNALWNGQYYASMSTSLRGGAFPDTDEVTGLILTHGGKQIVYCWGEGSDDENASIGDPEEPCDVSVRTTGMGGVATGATKGVGLYGGPTGGGSREEDFSWAVSSDGTDEFSSISLPNRCPSAPRLDCPLQPQVMAPIEFEDITQVWMNEIDVRNEGGDMKVAVEVVGRPGVTVVAEMVVTLAFYLGADQKGVDQTITLTPNEKFMNNYAHHQDIVGVEDAFHLTNTGGVLVTYDGLTIVYCWGPDARTQSIANGSECARVVSALPLIGADDGESTNVALYEDSENTPEDGGVREKDFKWERSAVTTSNPRGENFSTLGEVNKCPDGTASCTLGEQKLLPLAFPPSNDNVVWLNELDVVGSNVVGNVKVSLELVGRPEKGEGEDPPESISAVVTFYNGKEATGDPKTITLTPQDEDALWKGNFMGSVEDESTYGEAFPIDGLVAGLKLKYGEEERVYCWGVNARMDKVIGEEVKCQTVITTINMNSHEAQTNVALWNNSETPEKGGENAEDFEWGRSEIVTGSEAFGTIGNVNTCPNPGGCTTTDQLLAPYGSESGGESKSSSSSSSTTSTTTTAAETSGAVPRSSIGALGMAATLIVVGVF